MGTGSKGRREYLDRKGHGREWRGKSYIHGHYIVETLPNCSFPSSSMLISKTFMPKKTRETNIAGRGGQGNVESSRCSRIPYFLE